MEYKPRTTIYKGIEMRSRLEADVAKFLDKHLINWKYEPMRFQDEKYSYLPDFMINYCNDLIFLEVKPTEEQAKNAIDQMTCILHKYPNAKLSTIVGKWNNEKKYYDYFTFGGDKTIEQIIINSEKIDNGKEKETEQIFLTYPSNLNLNPISEEIYNNESNCLSLFNNFIQYIINKFS
jgi:hypothetical protein